jgi:hypothetical protein
LYSLFLPDDGSAPRSQSRSKETATAAKAKVPGGCGAFTLAGISLFAFHGMAFGQASAPEAPPAPPSVWQAHNRSLLAGLDFLNRRYTEFDHTGLTSDGILDSEKGTITGGAIRGRWQGAPFGQSPREVFLQAEYRRHTGSTNYQGYLQSGPILTPYSATTRNELHDFRARIGLPVARTESSQWVPFIEYRYQNWVRDLVQYRETFQHHAGVFGVLGQWRASPLWTLEGEASAGSILHAKMDATGLGFSGTLGNQTLWTLGASASYQIKNHWRAVASVRHEQSRYSRSVPSNGFIEPASRTKQTNTLLGIEYQF